VCVVDDDVGIRESLRFLLEEEGYAVEEAEDGGELVALLRTVPRPRVVLLDRMMARVDGVQTLRLLSQEPALTAHAVVIFMTARNDPVESDAGLVRQATFAAISKPFDLDELLTLVEQAHGHLAERGVVE
jgi:CheY-like chemotaxis protein